MVSLEQNLAPSSLRASGTRPGKRRLNHIYWYDLLGQRRQQCLDHSMCLIFAVSGLLDDPIKKLTAWDFFGHNVVVEFGAIQRHKLHNVWMIKLRQDLCVCVCVRVWVGVWVRGCAPTAYASRSESDGEK